jgi:hypothetical protein
VEADMKQKQPKVPVLKLPETKGPEEVQAAQQTQFSTSFVAEVVAKEFIQATVLELLKKEFIRISKAPEPAKAYCDLDPQTQTPRLRIQYSSTPSPEPPSLPSLDDILSLIPAGSITSLLKTSSLPGDGFWPIPVADDARYERECATDVAISPHA